MKKLWICAFSACLVSAGVFAQDYEFSVSGPESFSGAAGDSFTEDYTINLSHTGEPPAAQGWSLGVAVDGGIANSWTMEGTTAEANFNSEFVNNAVIDPDRNNGQQGVVSAVVLSITGQPAVLPAGETSSILIVNATFTIPEGGGEGGVRVTDGLRGPGQAVDVVVTEAGGSEDFTIVNTVIALNEVQSCCSSEFLVGFSADRLLNSTPGEGILDDTDTCNAQGSLQAAGPTTVYASVASNSTAGIQGWSISIEATGDIDIESVTSDNTSGANAPDGRGQSAFENTSLADPANNEGRRGVVSAIVLCLNGCGFTLDPVGTESLLALNIVPTDPAAESASGALNFISGLRGPGQPVANVLTVEGGSGDVCNFEVASVQISIEAPAAVGPFLSGDANNDGLVDIADPVWTINALFREGPASPCEIAADSNGDRAVDLSDVTYTIAYEFMSGPAPADGLECGTVEIDAAGDLTCESSSCE